MRPLALLLLALAVSGCYGTTTAPPRAPAPAVTGATTDAQRRAQWEDRWTQAKHEVAVARADAIAAGTPPAPQVDAEVTELLERDIGSETDAARIEELEDAVSDALRLAELVSLG
ncbi:MAG: hypothetical protein AAGG09_17355 [Pseudomonadota bacterium]